MKDPKNPTLADLAEDLDVIQAEVMTANSRIEGIASDLDEIRDLILTLLVENLE
jgi:hypothetical protein